jgi:DNA polymerase I-like protein with 3'-5' exonuclease and polymerase domains
LSAFASRTGRNQPSNAKFIFGPSTWLRSLIRPESGRAVAYVDWEQQEFGIAAALSGDRGMMAAYRSGDPYLTFAKQAGAVPADATKQTHKGEREQFKVCALAVQYGMSAESLARRLNVPPCRGRDLLRLHKQTYPTYWRWSDGVQDQAILTGRLSTVFGWTVHIGPDANPRSLRNFPMQANGAEMLRLACCLATERGIMVCAPVHDALLVEGKAENIDAVVADTQAAMRESSELVLPSFPLRTDAKIVRHPDRYLDDRGREFWETVWGLLDGGETCPTAGAGVVPSVGHPPSLISSLCM